MTRIVAVDGHALNPGDLDWAPLRELGELTVHARSTPSEMVQRLRHAHAVLTNKAAITDELLAQLPQLRYVGVTATGVNIVDLAAAARRHVVVTNVPGYSTDSVAQHVFALLLELVNRVGEHDAAVHRGQWAGAPDFSFTLATTYELAGRTLGIVGLGAIGQRVARIAQALNMNVAAAHQSSMSRVTLAGIRWLPVDELFAQSDVVSLHCPLTEQTRMLVNAARLWSMKKTAYLINTGRGPLVDEPALARALREGALAGAGLDVLSLEPPRSDNPLLTAPRCVITPHIAWATREARVRLMRITADNLRSFLAGQPVNVVNAR